MESSFVAILMFSSIYLNAALELVFNNHNMKNI